jgi:uncharacterized protein
MKRVPTGQDMSGVPWMRPALLLSAVNAALLLALSGQPVRAADPVELEWQQLMPVSSAPPSPTAWGMVQHGQLNAPPELTEAQTVTVATYDGQRVRIPGFIVPLEFEGDGVVSFLLVPYVGACIHVPPPPPNQIILVESKTPVVVTAAFDPITVTGTLEATARATELADVGYHLAAEEVAVYVQRRPQFLFQVQ